MNKKYLIEATQYDEVQLPKGQSNVKKIVDALDGIKNLNIWTNDELVLITTARNNIKAGLMSKYQAKKMWEKIQSANKQQQMLGIVKDFQEKWREFDTISDNTEDKNEVILSKCFYGGE